jgi:hypothetical protein
MAMSTTTPIAAISFVFLLAGCPGSLENPERFQDGGACSDVPTLLASKCGTSGCHASENPSNGLDLASADIKGRLTGQSAQGGSGLLIDEDTPDQSVIYTKLGESPPFGGRMPPGAPLDDATADCILAWLSE